MHEPSRNRIYLGKHFFIFLGADFLVPKRDHRREKQPVLGSVNLSKVLKNVELKTLCMPGCATQVYLNVSQRIVCINESDISISPVCPN